MNYDEFASANPTLDPVESIRQFSNQIRSDLLAAGQLTDETDREITAAAVERAVADGHIEAPATPDDALKAAAGIFSHPAVNNDVVNIAARKASEEGDDETAKRLRTYTALQAPAVKANFASAEEYDAALAAAKTDAESLLDESRIADAKRYALKNGLAKIATYTENGKLRVDAAPDAMDLDDKTVAEYVKAYPQFVDPSAALFVARNLKKNADLGLSPAQLVRKAELQAGITKLAENDPALKTHIDEITKGFAMGARSTGQTVVDTLGSVAAAAVSAATLAVSAGYRGLTGQPMPEVKTGVMSKPPEALAEYLYGYTDELGRQYSKQELLDVSKDLATAGGVDSLGYDEADPAASVRKLSTGQLVMPTSVMANKQLFDTALAKSEASELQKQLAVKDRESKLDAMGKQMLPILANADDDVLNFYNEKKAANWTDGAILESLSSNVKYNGFLNRAENFGLAALKTVTDLIPTIGKALPDGGLVENIGYGINKKINDEMSANQVLAKQFGKDMGWVQQLVEQVPQLAADILISRGAGRAAGAASRGAAFVAPETMAKLELFRTLKLPSLVGREVAEGIASKLAIDPNTAGWLISQGARTFGSTYVSTRSALETATNPDGSPKYTADQIDTLATETGILNAAAGNAITYAFNKIGGGKFAGAETLASGKGFSTRQLKGYYDDLVKGVAAVPKEIAGEIKLDSFENFVRSSTSFWARPLGEVLSGGVGETGEEFVQNIVEDTLTAVSTGRDLDLIESGKQAALAASFGFALGGGAEAISHAERQLFRDPQYQRADFEEQVLRGTIDKLRASNSPMTAAFLETQLGTARARKVAISDQLAQATQDYKDIIAARAAYDNGELDPYNRVETGDEMTVNQPAVYSRLARLRQTEQRLLAETPEAELTDEHIASLPEESRTFSMQRREQLAAVRQRIAEATAQISGEVIPMGGEAAPVIPVKPPVVRDNNGQLEWTFLDEVESESRTANAETLPFVSMSDDALAQRESELKSQRNRYGVENDREMYTLAERNLAAIAAERNRRAKTQADLAGAAGERAALPDTGTLELPALQPEPTVAQRVHATLAARFPNVVKAIDSLRKSKDRSLALQFSNHVASAETADDEIHNLQVERATALRARNNIASLLTTEQKKADMRAAAEEQQLLLESGAMAAEAPLKVKPVADNILDYTRQRDELDSRIADLDTRIRDSVSRRDGSINAIGAMFETRERTIEDALAELKTSINEKLEEAAEKIAKVREPKPEKPKKAAKEPKAATTAPEPTPEAEAEVTAAAIETSVKAEIAADIADAIENWDLPAETVAEKVEEIRAEAEKTTGKGERAKKAAAKLAALMPSVADVEAARKTDTDELRNSANPIKFDWKGDIINKTEERDGKRYLKNTDSADGFATVGGFDLFNRLLDGGVVPPRDALNGMLKTEDYAYQQYVNAFSNSLREAIESRWPVIVQPESERVTREDEDESPDIEKYVRDTFRSTLGKLHARLQTVVDSIARLSGSRNVTVTEKALNEWKLRRAAAAKKLAKLEADAGLTRSKQFIQESFKLESAKNRLEEAKLDLDSMRGRVPLARPQFLARLDQLIAEGRTAEADRLIKTGPASDLQVRIWESSPESSVLGMISSAEGAVKNLETEVAEREAAVAGLSRGHAAALNKVAAAESELRKLDTGKPYTNSSLNTAIKSANAERRKVEKLIAEHGKKGDFIKFVPASYTSRMRVKRGLTKLSKRDGDTRRAKLPLIELDGRRSGFFTNDPRTTADQLDAGYSVFVPKPLRKSVNNAIEVGGNGYVKLVKLHGRTVKHAGDASPFFEKPYESEELQPHNVQFINALPPVPPSLTYLLGKTAKSGKQSLADDPRPVDEQTYIDEAYIYLLNHDVAAVRRMQDYLLTYNADYNDLASSIVLRYMRTIREFALGQQILDMQIDGASPDRIASFLWSKFNTSTRKNRQLDPAFEKELRRKFGKKFGKEASADLLLRTYGAQLANEVAAGTKTAGPSAEQLDSMLDDSEEAVKASESFNPARFANGRPPALSTVAILMFRNFRNALRIRRPVGNVTESLDAAIAAGLPSDADLQQTAEYLTSAWQANAFESESLMPDAEPEIGEVVTPQSELERVIAAVDANPESRAAFVATATGFGIEDADSLSTAELVDLFRDELSPLRKQAEENLQRLIAEETDKRLAKHRAAGREFVADAVEAEAREAVARELTGPSNIVRAHLQPLIDLSVSTRLASEAHAAWAARSATRKAYREAVRGTRTRVAGDAEINRDNYFEKSYESLQQFGDPKNGDTVLATDQLNYGTMTGMIMTGRGAGMYNVHFINKTTGASADVPFDRGGFFTVSRPKKDAKGNIIGHERLKSLTDSTVISPPTIGPVSEETRKFAESPEPTYRAPVPSEEEQHARVKELLEGVNPSEIFQPTAPTEDRLITMPAPIKDEDTGEYRAFTLRESRIIDMIAMLEEKASGTGSAKLQQVYRDQAASLKSYLASYGKGDPTLHAIAHVPVMATNDIVAANDSEIAELGLTKDPASLFTALENAPDDLQPLAKLLLKHRARMTGVRFQIVTAPNTSWAGKYLPESRTIVINRAASNGRGVFDVLVHEMLHDLLFTAIRSDDPAAKRLVAKLESLRTKALAKAQADGETDPQLLAGLSSVDELAAYVFTSKDFQRKLHELDGPRNFLQKIIDAICSFLTGNPLLIRGTMNDLIELAGYSSPRPYGTTLSESVAMLNSSVTPTQQARISKLDADYLAAVESGDLETAQRMVYEAAKAANKKGPYVHGSAAESMQGAFRTGERDAGWFGAGAYLTLYESYAKRWGANVHRFFIPDGNYASIKAPNYNSITFEGDAELANLAAGGEDAFIENEALWSSKFSAVLQGMGYVGVNVELGGNPELEVVVFDPSQIKSADPVTYDEAGNVILLSQRFNPTSDNILYSAAISYDPSLPTAFASREDSDKVFVNPTLAAELVAELNDRSARNVLQALHNHEAAHIATFKTLTAEQRDHIANTLPESGMWDVADRYYAQVEPDADKRYARMQADRDSGALTNSKIAYEWLRSRVEILNSGYTSEEELAFWRGNPSLLSVFAHYLRGYINRLSAMVNSPADSRTAGILNRVARAHQKLIGGDVVETVDDAIAKIAEGEASFVFAMPVAGEYDARSAVGKWLGKYFGTGDAPAQVKRLIDSLDAHNKFGSRVVERFNSEIASHIKNGLITEENRAAMLEALGGHIEVDRKKLSALQKRADAERAAAEEEFRKTNRLAADRVALAEKQDAITLRYNDEFNKLWVEADNGELRKRQDEALAKLPPAVADTLRRMTAETAKNARWLVEDPNMPMDLRATIGANMGVHVVRTYRAFTQAGWWKMLKKGGTAQLGNEMVDFNKIYDNAVKVFTGFAEKQLNEKYANAGMTTAALKARVNDEVSDVAERMLDSFIDRYNELATGLMLGSISPKDIYEAMTGDPSSITLHQRSTNALKAEMSHYLARKDVPEWMRELMGEVKDPVEAAVRSFVTVSTLAGNQLFLSKLREEGLAGGWLTHDPASKNDERGYEELAEPSSAGVSVLGGLYGPPELKQVLEVHFKQAAGLAESSADAAIRESVGALRKAAGTAMGVKTLLSVGFIPRNALSDFLFFAPFQGLAINPFNSARWKASSHAAFSGIATDAEAEARIEKYIRLGVVENDARSSALRQQVRGYSENPEQTLAKMRNIVSGLQSADVLEKAKGVAGKPLEFMAKASSTVANHLKIMVYEQELEWLQKAYGNDPEYTTPDQYGITRMEREAADKTNRTTQTRSATAPIVTSFSRSPLGSLFAPFISFKAEVARILYNTPKLAKEEWKSGNPVMRKRALHRTIGMLTTATILPFTVEAMIRVAFAGLGKAFGDDEDLMAVLASAMQPRTHEELERDEALRKGLPEWQQNNPVSFAVTGSKVRTVDMTYINPFSIWMSPFLRSIEHIRVDDEEKITGTFVDWTTKQLIGEQIAFGAVTEAFNNRDDRGNLISTPDMPFFESLVTRAGYALKAAYMPPSATFVGRVLEGTGGSQKAKDEASRNRNRVELIAGELLGIRPRAYDTESLFETGMRRENAKLRDVRSATSVATSNYSVEEGRIADMIARNNRARINRGLAMKQMLDEFGKLGLDTGRMISLAREAGVSKEAVKLAAAGYVSAYSPSLADKKTIYLRRQEVDGTGAQSLLEMAEEMKRWSPMIRLEK